MKRPLIAVLGALLALAVVAVSVWSVDALMDRRDDRRPGGMPHSFGAGDPHRGGAMHGADVTSEFNYLVEMVAHHEEAVQAARELRRSDRREMRDFGAAIVRTQTEQIEQMQAWLAKWYPGRSTDADYEPMMRDLSDLSGERLDVTFLQDMIPHHMGAVRMSQQFLVRDLAEHEPVAELARSIRDEQHAEIFEMHQWLADMDGRGSTHMNRG